MSASVEISLRDDASIRVDERQDFSGRGLTRRLRVMSGGSTINIEATEEHLRKFSAAITAFDVERAADALAKAKEAVEAARRLGVDVAIAEPAGPATAAMEGGA